MSRKKSPAKTEAAVLVKSRRRCCLCAHIDGDHRVKLGQIAHLDQDPSNSDEDNLAFLCFSHHSEYDSKTSQHKNFTQAEVQHWRNELYQQMAQFSPTPNQVPAPRSGDRLASERRKKDLAMIKVVFRTIHWPTLDQHVEELPYIMIGPVLHFWEGFHSVVSSSLFHIYDPVFSSEIQNLHHQWNITVSFGIHYIPRLDGTYIFANTGHQPFNRKQEKDWDTILKAARALAEVKTRLLDYVRNAFEEVDIVKLSDEAWSEYLRFQTRFSL